LYIGYSQGVQSFFFTYLAEEGTFILNHKKTFLSNFQEEFLLSAPGGLGMFVTSAGMSERPPIQWTKPVLKLIYCHPYIIALTESRDNVVVYR
jgi:hypothetical protein